MLGLEREEAQCWLSLGHTAAADGQLPAARAFVEQARVAGAPQAFVHSAVLQQLAGQPERAQREIEGSAFDVGRLAREVEAEGGRGFQNGFAVLRLLLATNWLADGSRRSSADITERFQACTGYQSGSIGAAAQFYYARFVDQQLQQCVARLADAIEAQASRGGSGVSRSSAGSRTGSSSASAAGASSSLGPTDDDIRKVRMGRDALARTAVENYAGCLSYTGRYVYQALPRVLTLYFDTAAAVHGAAEQARGVKEDTTPPGFSQPSKDCLQAMSVHVRKLSDTVAGGQWVTVLPQLISRVCHKHEHVWMWLYQNLARLGRSYPDQCVWYYCGLTMSRFKTRVQRGGEIIRRAIRARHGAASAGPKFEAASKLFERLVAAAQLRPKSRRQQTVRLDFGDLNLSSRSARLMLPSHEALTPVVPTAISGSSSVSADGTSITDAADVLELLDTHCVSQLATESAAPGLGLDQAALDAVYSSGFLPPEHRIWIQSVDAKARVMSSKEKPKQITVQASDGRSYRFLCKQETKGDLRKDARVMEYASTINRLFRRDQAARQRRLRLRAYAVVCLNEECGLLEWVEHTAGYRSTLDVIYQEGGLGKVMEKTMKWYKLYTETQDRARRHQGGRDTRAKLLEVFAGTLGEFPAIFHRWFAQQFPHPNQWLAARMRFTRSSAVWSMAGHVLGLGDRHGENILLDVTSGEAVHVDFDCIFDKGLRLQVPELVPFRLTSNMLDGMGLAGYEGSFRRVSEVVLSVLRAQKEQVMSLLESFVHDPLVEWTRASVHTDDGARLSRTQVSTENHNQDAVRTLCVIRRRLDGSYNLPLPRRAIFPRARSAEGGQELLAVSGQVHRLLQEATSPSNLACMYIGWMPFV